MKGALLACLAIPTLAGQGLDQPPERGRPAEVASCDSTASGLLAARARQPVTAPDKAASLLVEAHRACPERAALLLEAAHLLVRIGEFDRALETADEFRQRDGGSVPGLLAIGEIQLKAQRFEDASRTASLVLRRDTGNPTALKLHGNATYFLGSAQEAEGIFLRLLDKHPGDAEGAYMLGRIYYEENRFSHAAAQFEKVLRLEPGNYKAYDNLGLSYEALGESDKAVQNYLAAIQLVETARPDYDWPFANLASLLINQGDPGQGFDAAFTAAKRNPRSPRNFFLGGKALMMLGRHQEALRWLERSTVLDPTDSRPWYLLSQLHARLGDDESAQRAVAEFLKAKSNEPDASR